MRNWDYRYGWIRDASYTPRRLGVAACPHEAADFVDYLTNAATAHGGPYPPTGALSVFRQCGHVQGRVGFNERR